MIHGKASLQQVIESTDALFKRPISDLSLMTEGEFLDHFKSTNIMEIEWDEKLTTSGLVQMSGLRKTRADAKRIIQQNGLFVNGAQASEDVSVREMVLLHGKFVVLQIGKKNYSLIRLKNKF